MKQEIPVHLRVARLAFSGLQAVAPTQAERSAAHLFFTPHRKHRPRAPRVEGLTATAFCVDVGQGRLAAWSWGEGPTVLLVHGWASIGARMAGFVKPLVDDGYRVVAFDMPAHGRSTAVGGPKSREVSIVDMAAAIRAVAAVVGPLHGIVAHSMGGAATTLAVGQGLEVRRVVLLAPAADGGYFARNVAKLLGLSAPRAEGMLRLIRQRLAGLNAANEGAEAVSLDVADRVPERAIPMLALHDPADAEVPLAHGERIADAWPGARLEKIDGVGHHRIVTDPAVVHRAVTFLETDYAAAATVVAGAAPADRRSARAEQKREIA